MSIRVESEHGRSCNGCGARSWITLFVIGTSQIRCCGPCWEKLKACRQRVLVEGITSCEVS